MFKGKRKNFPFFIFKLIIMAQIKKAKRGIELSRIDQLNKENDLLLQDESVDENKKAQARAILQSAQNIINAEQFTPRDRRLYSLGIAQQINNLLKGNKAYSESMIGDADKNIFGYYSKYGSPSEIDWIINETFKQTIKNKKENIPSTQSQSTENQNIKQIKKINLTEGFNPILIEGMTPNDKIKRFGKFLLDKLTEYQANPYDPEKYNISGLSQKSIEAIPTYINKLQGLITKESFSNSDILDLGDIVYALNNSDLIDAFNSYFEQSSPKSPAASDSGAVNIPGGEQQNQIIDQYLTTQGLSRVEIPETYLNLLPDKDLIFAKGADGITKAYNIVTQNGQFAGLTPYSTPIGKVDQDFTHADTYGKGIFIGRQGQVYIGDLNQTASDSIGAEDYSAIIKNIVEEYKRKYPLIFNHSDTLIGLGDLIAHDRKYIDLSQYIPGSDILLGELNDDDDYENSAKGIDWSKNHRIFNVTANRYLTDDELAALQYKMSGATNENGVLEDINQFNSAYPQILKPNDWDNIEASTLKYGSLHPDISTQIYAEILAGAASGDLEGTINELQQSYPNVPIAKIAALLTNSYKNENNRKAIIKQFVQYILAHPTDSNYQDVVEVLLDLYQSGENPFQTRKEGGSIYKLSKGSIAKRAEQIRQNRINQVSSNQSTSTQTSQTDPTQVTQSTAYTEYQQLLNDAENDSRSMEGIINGQSTELSPYTKQRMATTALDIAGLIASFVPTYGTAASGIEGAISMIWDLGIDIADPSVTWKEVGENAAVNLGMIGLGLLPGGKFGKVGKSITKLLPYALTLYSGTQQAKELSKTIDEKGWNFDQWTNDDWNNTLFLLKTASGLGTMKANQLSKNRNLDPAIKTSTKEVNVEGGNKVELSIEQWNELKNEGRQKGQNAANIYLNRILGNTTPESQVKLDPSKINFGIASEGEGKLGRLKRRITSNVDTPETKVNVERNQNSIKAIEYNQWAKDHQGFRLKSNYELANGIGPAGYTTMKFGNFNFPKFESLHNLYKYITDSSTGKEVVDFNGEKRVIRTGKEKVVTVNGRQKIIDPNKQKVVTDSKGVDRILNRNEFLKLREEDNVDIIVKPYKTGEFKDKSGKIYTVNEDGKLVEKKPKSEILGSPEIIDEEILDTSNSPFEIEYVPEADVDLPELTVNRSEFTQNITKGIRDARTKSRPGKMPKDLKGRTDVQQISKSEVEKILSDLKHKPYKSNEYNGAAIVNGQLVIWKNGGKFNN